MISCHVLCLTASASDLALMIVSRASERARERKKEGERLPGDCLEMGSVRPVILLNLATGLALCCRYILSRIPPCLANGGAYESEVHTVAHASFCFALPFSKAFQNCFCDVVRQLGTGFLHRCLMTSLVLRAGRSGGTAARVG